MNFGEKVEARSLQVGKIYGGTADGEVQKDANGQIWWKRADGSIMEIHPAPSILFYFIKDVEA